MLPRRNPSNSIAAKLALADAEFGPPEYLDDDVPDGSGLKFIDLRNDSCRFPRGDPREPDFEFCGCKSLPALPYCAHHTRKALRPMQWAPKGVEL